ncbi:MAG: outer membrane beta-barrel protein [Bacteroidales bacterium]|nr:outer membrane beta-barrel protein [Bacteroidales bacterium]
MKKVLSLIVVALLFAGVSQAQKFTTESFAANLGLGFGWYDYGYGVSSFPAISLSAEKGMWELEDIGVVSIGGSLAYKTAKYDYSYTYNNVTDEWSWTDFAVAARSALHPDLIDNDKVDLYAGAALGLRFQTFKYTDAVLVGVWPNYNYEIEERKNNDTDVLFAVFAGGRYYFTDNFGVFAELGYGLGYLTIGISYGM